MGIQEFNLPDKNDPDFADKLVNLISQLFSSGEAQVQNLQPIDTPTEGTQIGSFWFNQSTEKIEVKTSTGIKVLKYE